MEQEKGKNNEWFHVTGQESRIKFYDFRMNHGILQQLSAVIPYRLRKEQEEAVEKTVEYEAKHKNGEFLWNAKPRFGKNVVSV